jgi:hypothetical protein
VASANSGYEFTNWTEGGTQVSTNSNYTFTVTSNRTLVANFVPSIPAGAINGLFSVSSTQQVWFSQGNLQYQASTNTWRFASNQWDYIGYENSNISSTYSGWIDLFGWGTSGFNHGAVCYQPWSTSITNCDYYAYGSDTYNLFDQSGQADWGYNMVSNGGNATNQWRTMSIGEWNYVFNTRTTSSGIRFAKAKVNDVKGMIILPDNWSNNNYTLNNVNNGNASYNSNVISSSIWTNCFLAHGAVFLPAAGGRGADLVYYTGEDGLYWSSSYNDGAGSFIIYFGNLYLYTYEAGDRYFGRSVRLVQDFQ